MGFCIKDGMFAVNLASVGRSLWIRSCGAQNCSRRATVRLGIDTLIDNTLVYLCSTVSLSVPRAVNLQTEKALSD